MKRVVAALWATSLVALTAVSPALAGKPNPVSTINWSGQGTVADGDGGLTLTNMLCAPDPGADSTNNYLLFVLSSVKSLTSTPTISVNGGSAVAMTKSSGKTSGASSYKYVFESTSSINLSALTATANWTGAARPTLTISHGCAGGGGDTPQGLTIVFTGQATSTSTFGNNNANIEFCEYGSTTNCVTFSKTETPGTTKTLTLSSSPTYLHVSGAPDCAVWVWGTAPTAAAAYAATGSTTGFLFWGYENSADTSGTYSNADTVYWTDRTNNGDCY